MRAPLSWLRDFAPFGDDVERLTATLDDLGLVVEGLERTGQGLEGISVARVVQIAPIEGADRIRLVTADTAQGTVEVVCGARNFAAGDLVAFAPPGTTLPDGTEIARRAVRGVISNGMLCSGKELGVSEDARGLLVLTDVPGAKPGASLSGVLGIEPDVVFEITVEGDRPDAWSMAGVARDLAARLGLPFSAPAPRQPRVSGPAVHELASVVVVDPALCPRFTAHVLQHVTVGASPTWMARRLALAGMRPVNNVVDASNYVMLELGQPTHPYDLDRLGGRGLRVRRARRGELLVTLDGVERRLGVPGPALGDTGEDCLICDAEDRPVGIGGVMGGASSEIGEGTERVLLEAAYFTPTPVTRTASRLALRTEASARFERGTDPWAIQRAAHRLCQLLQDQDPGVIVAPGALDVRGEVPEPFQIPVPHSAVRRSLGIDLDRRTVAGLLEPIGFGVAAPDGGEPAGRGDLVVTVPTSRPDVRPAPLGVADLIEEVARTYGYARIPRRRPAWPQPGRLGPRQRERRLLRDLLAGLGASEAWTSSLVSTADHERAGLRGPAVEVVNPQQATETVLRRSLLPGLVRVLVYNNTRRQGEVRLFEVGVVFAHPDEPTVAMAEARGDSAIGTLDVPHEREMLAAAFALADDDARTAVAAWHAIADGLRLEQVRIVAAAPGLEGDDPLGPVPGLHPTRSAWLVAAGAVVGAVGEVDPLVLERFGWQEAGDHRLRRVGWLELDLERLLDLEVVRRRSEKARAVSRFPSSDIDLALVVDDRVPADRVSATVRRAGGELLESLRLFDVFRSPALGAGRRSLAFRLRFCAMDRTLTDEEVGRARAACIEAASKEHGAELRA